MATSAEVEVRAPDAWNTAQKARRLVVKKLEKMKVDMVEGKEEAYLEELEKSLAEFRLHCVATILTDFEYAVSQNVESLLWQTHSHVNSEYRKLIGRAKFNDRDVLKRKIEKLYFTFLKTSQLFYRGYLQRLAAAFDIPELERVARGVGLQPMEKVARIDVVDPNVEASVRKSAHQTLIHLGDLARYRNQMRHKGPSESALVSYSLAQQVDPNSGFAHHQMGVIAVDEKKHLNVVYHLYRAIAVAEPHPNAIPNLEAEFNNLLVPSTLASRNPKSDEDAMRDWFVKLHAYFYRGENFAAHRELEDEVMHRLELALKHEAWSEVNSDLFKMVIINLAAYAVANDKVQMKWTMEASQSCQFILRLNMRTISILARIACDELQDVVDRGELTPKGKSVEEEPIKISPVMEKILPLLRLYTSWLGSVRLQVVQYEDHLEPHVKDMYRYLAKCFSLLIEVFKDDNLATAEYLLHEDLETLGFQPLVHGDIPETFRIHYNEMTGVDKQRGSGTGSKKREGINRVRDIIACGLHLAEDEKFPFGVSMQRKANGAEMPTVIYVEDGATSHGHPSALSPLDSHVSTLRAPDIASSAGPSVSTAAPESGIDEGADDSMEKRMVNMVNDLVSQSETGSENTTEGTSYGMHSTATVDQVLAAVASSSSQPPSALSEAIPSLPWRSSAGAGPSIGSSAQADQLQQGRETLEDPFFTMEVKDIPRFSWDRISPTSWGHPPSASQREQGMKILEKKIAEFTTNEAGERAPLNNTLGYNSTGQADTTDDWSSPIHAAAALYSPYHQPAQAPVASPYAHHHLAGPSSAISPYGHYQPTSTPRLGGPHQRIAQASPWGQTPTRQRTVQMPSIGSAFDQQISPAPQDRLQTASPYAVARPNQNQQHVGPPRTGLPMSLSSPAVTGNVYQSTPCNGITYNATTAYGRGDIVTRDDPTAYRNMARASGLSDDADAYDRAVLMRALEDDVKR